MFSFYDIERHSLYKSRKGVSFNMRRLFGGFKSKSEGKAKFIQNKIVFEDGAKFVTITAPTNTDVKIIVNGIIATGEFVLTPNDEINIVYENNEIEKYDCNLSLDVSDDEMEATLKKEVVFGKRLEFSPIVEYTDHLKLKVIEVDTPPPPLETDEIKEFILSKGLDADYQEENIAKIAFSNETIELIIMEGRRPKHGKPAGFELIEGIDDESLVGKDQFFAEYVDETPGDDGKNVFGDAIPAETPMVFPDFGPNVLIEDRGLMSLAEGRLIFTPHKIDIIEIVSVEKTINWEDGFVHYESDVTIDGDVKEGGQIKCDGNITIKGGVFESYVFSDGHINVEGNIEQSVVYSGFSKFAAKNIETYSLQYLVIMERVMFERSFYADDGSNYLEKNKSIELAESEFKAIEQSVAPFISLVTQNGSGEVKALYDEFNTTVSEAKEVVLNDESNADQVKEKMELFYELIENSKALIKDTLGELVTNSSNRSHLFSFSDTIISGSGIYQTNIESYKEVDLSNKSFVSSITAENGITIGEFNPGSDPDLFLDVKKSNGFINAKKIIPECILKLDSKKHLVEDEMEDVRIDRNNFPKNN